MVDLTEYEKMLDLFKKSLPIFSPSAKENMKRICETLEKSIEKERNKAMKKA
jgi:hypothetical protein